LYPEFVNRQTFHALCNCIKDTSFMTPLLCNCGPLRSQPPNVLFMLREFDDLRIRLSQIKGGEGVHCGKQGRSGQPGRVAGRRAWQTTAAQVWRYQRSTPVFRGYAGSRLASPAARGKSSPFSINDDDDEDGLVVTSFESENWRLIFESPPKFCRSCESRDFFGAEIDFS
jgi:hypothetical protein